MVSCHKYPKKRNAEEGTHREESGFPVKGTGAQNPLGARKFSLH